MPGSHDETEGHEPDHGAADDVQHGRRVAPRESETGLLSGRLVAVVTVCSGRECIDCVPHSLLLLLPAPQSVPPEFYTSPPAAATATITRTTSAWRQSCCASDQTRFYFHGHQYQEMIKPISDILIELVGIQDHKCFLRIIYNVWLVQCRSWLKSVQEIIQCV